MTASSTGPATRPRHGVAGLLHHHRPDALSATPRPPGSAPDQPLRGLPHPFDRLHPSMYAAEFAGTALLVAVGLSIVVALWGHGGPLAALPLAPAARRCLNGFLFGGVGALIAYSALGRISGAHINPAMTFAFWLEGRIGWRDAVCYVVAQLAGGLAGAGALLFWGGTGASVEWGASLPARGAALATAVAGETLCTFLLVVLIFAFAARTRTQPYTPLVNPVLFAVLVMWEGPLTGASANPARSFGPAWVAADWRGWWVYWIGPALGAALAVGLSRAGIIGRHQPHQARLFHFGHPGGIAPTVVHDAAPAGPAA